MKNQHLLVLLLASASIVGCDVGGKSPNKGFGDISFPKSNNGIKYQMPKLEFPQSKTPQKLITGETNPFLTPPKQSPEKQGVPKVELPPLADLFTPTEPFPGYTFKTIRTNEVDLNVEIPNYILDTIKQKAAQIANLSIDSAPNQMAILNNQLKQHAENARKNVYLGSTKLIDCIGKTLLTKDQKVIKLTKEVIDAIEKELNQLILDTIEKEYRKAEEEMEDAASDTDSDFSTDSDRDSDLDSMESTLFMRHAKNGEFDMRLTDWYKTDLKIPFFAKIEKSTEHTLTNTEFVKFGNILFGAKQKFNTLKNTLESLGATSAVMFHSAFMELHLETTKSNQSQRKLTLGYDIKDWGITPYLQTKSLKNTYAVCGITFDAYNKQSTFLKYSLNFNAQTIRNLTNGKTTYTVNTYGQVTTTGGVKASYTLKLAPNYTEVNLSLGFEL